ncbi:MAG: O-antigen/teichoic acid export membrane protein [Patiriisocius sp.]|jgi:O-antigen/teichoic acid export membrane protein
MEQKTLKKQVVLGLAWRGSTDVLQQVLQIVFTIILARLLTKGDFGLVAMALLVNRFVRSVTNVSFGTAIIQNQEITKGQISAIFVIQTSLNIVLTAIVFFGAEFAAGFFNEPELVPVIKVLSLLVLLQSLQFPNLLLQKKMQFKSFSISQIISMLASNIIAVVLAFMGYGLWALVWRLVIQSVIFGFLSFVFGKWLPSKPSFIGLKPLMSFGFNLLGRNIFYFFAENMIGLMTGKFLGKETMGLFNIAYNLAIVPASKIQNILTSVLTSGFSKIQYEVVKFRENYKKALNYTALIFIPFMLLLSAISTNLIPVLYGKEWGKAGEFLMVLSVVGIIRGLSHMVRTAIVSKGNTRVIFYSAVVELVISLPFMYFLIQGYGVKGLISGYLIGALSSLVYLVFYFDKILEKNHLFFNAIKNGLLVGVVIFASAMSVWFLNSSDLVSLILKITIAFFIFILMLSYFENSLVKSISNKFRKFVKN